MPQTRNGQVLALLCLLLALPLCRTSLAVLFPAEEPRTEEPADDSSSAVRAKELAKWQALQDEGSETVLVDAALLVLDRGSLGEAIVISGSIALKKDVPALLRLEHEPVVPTPGTARTSGTPWFDRSRPSKLNGGSRNNTARFSARSSHPDLFGAHGATLDLELLYRGRCGDSHLVQVHAEGTRRISYRNSSFSSLMRGQSELTAVEPNVPLAMSLSSRDAAALIALRETDAAGSQESRLERWIDEAREAATSGPLSTSDAQAITDFVQAQRWTGNVWPLLRIADPGLEFAQLAVHLADAQLADEARSILGDDRAALSSRVQAAAPKIYRDRDFWDDEMGDVWMAERWASLSLIGSVPFADLPGPLRTGEGHSDPARWISEYLDPVRVHGVARATAPAQAAARGEMNRGYANYRLPHGHAARTYEAIGATDGVRESWDELRRYYAGELGWMPRLALDSSALVFFLTLLPWILGLGWVFLAGRGSGSPAITLLAPAVLVVTVLSLLRLGQSPKGLLTIPFWLWYARAWCRSEQAEGWHRWVLGLVIGGLLASVLAWLRLSGTFSAMEPWSAAAPELALIALGFHFAARGDAWRTDLWLWMLTVLVGMFWLPASTPSELAFLALIIAAGLLLLFFIASPSDHPKRVVTAGT